MEIKKDNSSFLFLRNNREAIRAILMSDNGSLLTTFFADNTVSRYHLADTFQMYFHDAIIIILFFFFLIFTPAVMI